MATSCLSNYTLVGIGFDCNPNLAGIREVYLTYFDNVSVEGAIDYSAHTIIGSAVTFEDSAITWYKYDFARDTSSLTSNLTKDDSNGTRYYTNTIELVFNKLTAMKHLEVMAMAAEKLAAIVVDNNGRKWYVGADAYISGTEEEVGTGASADDRNGYTVTLAGTSAYLPFKYEGDIEYTDAPTDNS